MPAHDGREPSCKSNDAGASAKCGPGGAGPACLRHPWKIDSGPRPRQIRGVTDEPKPEPRLTPDALRARAAREARQGAALRANLRRRKAQERGRAMGEDAAVTDPAHSLYPDISDEH